MAFSLVIKTGKGLWGRKLGSTDQRYLDPLTRRRIVHCSQQLAVYLRDIDIEEFSCFYSNGKRFSAAITSEARYAFLHLFLYLSAGSLEKLCLYFRCKLRTRN